MANSPTARAAGTPGRCDWCNSVPAQLVPAELLVELQEVSSLKTARRIIELGFLVNQQLIDLRISGIGKFEIEYAFLGDPL
jgi:hypothetical protein